MESLAESATVLYVSAPRSEILPTSNTLQLLITQLQGLLCLMLKPISLAHIKSSIFGNRHSCIKVCCTLELLLKPSIVFELGEQG